jgi:hypothetical protein
MSNLKRFERNCEVGIESPPCEVGERGTLQARYK